MYKVASSYCRNAADRDDLIQETVLQLWRSFDRYDDTLRFSTWMYRVAVNVAVSSVRHQTRKPRHVELDEHTITVIDERSTESAEKVEQLRMLQGFIEGFNELDRALVVLYLDGNPHETIAEILGISASNVGTKINRIKNRLKQQGADQMGKE